MALTEAELDWIDARYPNHDAHELHTLLDLLREILHKKAVINAALDANGTPKAMTAKTRLAALDTAWNATRDPVEEIVA